MPKRPNITIIIPVYNEAKVIAGVVSSVIETGFTNIVVVDDGSTDNSWDIIQKLPVIAVRHALNRGKGAATTTGIQAARIQGAEIFITMDGDGQHEAQDIKSLIKPILYDNIDVALGVRILDEHQMPLYKKIQNTIADKITFMLYGIHVHDSQSGMRGFSAHAISRIQTRSDAYSYESEVLREIKKHYLKFVEVPIHVRYTTYSRTKQHGQSIANGLKTLYTMIWNILS